MKGPPSKAFFVGYFILALLFGAGFAGDCAVVPAELLQGAVVTVEITVAGCLLAVVVAFLAAARPAVRPAPLRWLATGYIEIFRGTSALVQLFWLFFVLPQFGVEPSAPFPSPSSPSGSTSAPTAPRWCAAPCRGVARGQWEARPRST